MAEDAPDLFVVCRNCGSQVSPYVTECPYCGNRMRKRAPKLGSRQDPARKANRRWRRRRGSSESAIAVDRRLIAVPVLVVATIITSSLLRAGLLKAARIEVAGPLFGDWWKLLTAPFAVRDVGYGAMVLTIFALFGALLERRIGRVAVVVLWIAAGALGGYLASILTIDPAGGPLAIALAVCVAWTGSDVLERRRGVESERDVIAGVIAGASLFALPLLVSGATWAQLSAGLLCGLVGGGAIAIYRR